MIREQGCRGIAVREIQSHEPEAALGPQLFEPSFLQGAVIVLVEIIHPNYAAAAFEKSPGKVKADKASHPCNENSSVHLFQPSNRG
jgi:hypothetical protein